MSRPRRILVASLLLVFAAASARAGEADEARKLVEDYLAVERDRAEVRRSFLGPI